MKLKHLFRLPWRTRSQIVDDIDAELTFHLESRVADLVRDGRSPAEAARMAREEFGNLDGTRNYCRDLDLKTDRAVRSADRFAGWREDLRQAGRTLRHSPGYTAVSLLTLALAIGANTAIFTVVRAVLLRPLPYADPGSLVAVQENWPERADETTPLSPPNYVDYREQQRTFTDIAALVARPITWRPEAGDPVTLDAITASPGLFGVLGVPAWRGRLFAPGDDAPGAGPTAVVSYRFWRRSLGADDAAVGRLITLDGRAHRLIGVMPPGFTIDGNEEVFTPLDLSDELARSPVTRRQHWLQGIGRLKPGTTIETARADLAVVARRLEAAYPDANTGRFAVLTPLHQSVVGDLGTPVLLLQGSALVVLLIAVANLANLTLSRTVGRRREIALRAALGAGRGRLVRQLLTESVVLAAAGGALGVALAVVATRTLLALNPEALPSLFVAGVDRSVLLFSIAVSVGTGILFGLAPAFHVARADLNQSLKGGGRGASGDRGGERSKRTLVVVQVGLAFTLLIGAGLLVRSFGELSRVRLGFDPDRVLTAELTTSGERYDSLPLRNQLFDGVLADLATSPGVVAAGAALYLPTRGHLGSSIRIEGEPVDETRIPEIRYVSIRGDYFEALRIPLVAGRRYDESDGYGGPKTVLINETAVRAFFPRGDAVGRRIRIGPRPDGPWMTIIGVVADVLDQGLDNATRPTLFASHRQEPWDRTLTIVVRTTGRPDAAVPALRRAVRAADPALPIREIRSLEDVVGGNLASRRFSLGLAGCFAGVALLLAAVGIYGVLSHMVTARGREFGVRLALGATAGDVRLLVTRQGLRWALVGVGLGIGGAIGAGRLLRGLLYGVTPTDPTTYLAVGSGLLLVVLVACLVPALRATRVDPITIIRAE